MDKMENMNDSLWERIESLMKLRNLNQKEFAAEIGVNPVTITEWKKGKSRSYQKLATMRRIANALGVSVEELTQEKVPAPKSGNGRSETPNEMEERFMNAVRLLLPEQQAFLLEMMEATVRKNQEETRQTRPLRSVVQAAPVGR